MPSCNFSATGSANSVATLDLDTNGLQDNGGPTETIALQTGSAAIDAIPSASCTYQGTLDPCTVPPSQTISSQLNCDQPLLWTAGSGRRCHPVVRRRRV